MFVYMAQNTFNGHDLSSKHQTMKIIMPASCQPINRTVPVQTLRAEVAVQARHYYRACRTWIVLFSVVFGPAHRVSAR